MKYHRLIEKCHRRDECELSYFLSTIGLSHLYPIFNEEGFIPKVISGITKDMLPKKGLKAGESSRILKAAKTYNVESKCHHLEQSLADKHKIEEILKKISEVTELEVTLDGYDKLIEFIKQQKKLSNHQGNHTKHQCSSCKKETMVLTHSTTENGTSKVSPRTQNGPSRIKNHSLTPASSQNVDLLAVHLFSSRNSNQPKSQ